MQRIFIKYILVVCHLFKPYFAHNICAPSRAGEIGKVEKILEVGMWRELIIEVTFFLPRTCNELSPSKDILKYLLEDLDSRQWNNSCFWNFPNNFLFIMSGFHWLLILNYLRKAHRFLGKNIELNWKWK